MNELDLVAELRPEVPLASPDELEPARDALASAIAAEAGAYQSDWARAGAHGGGAAVGGMMPAAVPRRRRSARRVALAGTAVTAVAAGIAVALVVVTAPAGSPARPGAAAAGPAAPSAAPPAGRLMAARFLTAAAHAVRRQAAAPPRPDQYVYSESAYPDGSRFLTWLSADGSRRGLNETVTGHPAAGSTPAPVGSPKPRPDGSPAPAGAPAGNSLPACTTAQAIRTTCYPEAGYLPDLPTQPGAILAYLDRIHLAETQLAPPGGGGNWAANDLGKALFETMEVTYLRPAQLAALYQLMAHMPGFTEVPRMLDATGRAGVGIVWHYDRAKSALIIDPTTYAFLGIRTWPAAGYTGPGAHQYDGSALIQIAVVNHLGQLP